VTRPGRLRRVREPGKEMLESPASDGGCDSKRRFFRSPLNRRPITSWVAGCGRLAAASVPTGPRSVLHV